MVEKIRITCPPPSPNSVITKLLRSRVWELLTDITNWPKFSDVYSNLHWVGEPWAEGSLPAGELNYPIVVSGQYVVRASEPPVLIRYLSPTREAGFATERTIRLEQLGEGTLIQVDAFVGEPKMPGGALEFLKGLTTRWFSEFAGFCDRHANASSHDEGQSLETGSDMSELHSADAVASWRLIRIPPAIKPKIITVNSKNQPQYCVGCRSTRMK